MNKLILSLIIACSASWVSAQDILFDTSVFTNSAAFPDNFSYGGSDEIFADDATLATPGIITRLEVEFVNSGINLAGQAPSTTADIVFALWADNGSGAPQTTPLWSVGLTSLTFNGGITSDPSSFVTTVSVAVPNVAVTDTLYWSAEVHNLTLGAADFGAAFGLRRYNEGNPPGPTGTSTTTGIWGDQSQASGGTPTWVQATDTPLAITIFGVAVPEPSMAGLFLIGLACLGLARKFKAK